MACIEIALDTPRNQYIGGSDVAAVMGMSPYHTPVELWRLKTGRAKPDNSNAGAKRRGKILEPYVVQMVVDRLREEGYEVEVVARNKRYRDVDMPFLSCEIDSEFRIRHPAAGPEWSHINVDCKTAHGFSADQWGDEGTDEVPIHYASQFVFGTEITGRPRTLVAALIGLDDVVLYWVEHDPVAGAAMRERCARFWHECIVADKAPDPVNFDDVKLLYPSDNGKHIEATAEVAALVRQLAQCRQQATQFKKDADALAFQVGEYIRPYSILTLEGQEIATFKAQGRTQFEIDAFRTEHPALAAEFTTHQTIRVLRTKGKAK